MARVFQQVPCGNPQQHGSTTQPSAVAFIAVPGRAAWRPRCAECLNHPSIADDNNVWVVYFHDQPDFDQHHHDLDDPTGPDRPQ
jgi:hypothetical protein